MSHEIVRSVDLRQLSGTFAALCLVLVAAQASAEEATTVRNLLDRMSHAISNMDYEGVFVYQRGDQLETIRIIHRATGTGEQERLISLNGAPREIVRTDNVVTCILSEGRSIIVDRRLTQSLFPALPPSQANDLEQYYSLEMLGTGRVAGLGATVIGVEPRDHFRYGYRLWLERDTGMLLKSELLGHDGKVIEQLMFTSINLGGNVPIGALQPHSINPNLDFGPLPATPQKPKPLPEDDFDWAAAGLPPGFRLKVHQWERLAEDAPPAEHLVFTDGLASVSVYVEQADEVRSPAPAGVSSLGAVTAFIRKLDEHRITAVGEVPAITVKTIASGVYRRGAAVTAND